MVVRKRISIGLVGEYDKSVPAHQAAEDEEGEVRAADRQQDALVGQLQAWRSGGRLAYKNAILGTK